MIRLGLGNVRIKGLSGKTYKFRAYPLNTKFADFGAVYFITGRKLDAEGRTSHSRIYCGQTKDMSVPSFTAAQVAAFDQHAANCICVLPVQFEVPRLEIEKDIHRNYRLLSRM
jgi:hypothetical protein